MRRALVLAAAALVCFTVQGASAADMWIGAWGFPTMPYPPGFTPPLRFPTGLPIVYPPMPLGVVAPPRAARGGEGGGQGRIDNPGNVPVAPSNVDLTNVTVRQVVRVSAAGKRVRLRFSNEIGTEAFVLGGVHIGEMGADGAVVPGTDRQVMFDGQSGVAIPASAPELSDPIDLPVKALDKLLVSVYVPGTIPRPRDEHVLLQYVAGQSGDSTAQAQLPGVKLMRVMNLLTEVDVDAVIATNAVVTLGDSITEGATSTANAFHGWPDRLAERLLASKTGSKWSVVNAAITGNRLLRYGNGLSVLARFDRDVLSVPGVKAVIVMEGINDIGRSFFAPAPEPVTAEALEAANKQIIARAHAHGIRVLGVTLTPYEGADYYTPQGEAVREAFNQWVRTSGAFDGVLDFAAVVADPTNPNKIRSDYNIRDHLHPDDRGYQALADSIDLTLITGK